MFAQQRTKIVLQTSDQMIVDNKTQITRLQRPIFEHDGAILTCDSARLWSELNYFEAFGNVHIRQDTVNIFSDKLNYDGNAKMAHLMNNVRMSDPSTTLTTNIFDYNMASRVGTYVDNGKIVNKENNVTVTSKRGYYLASTKDAYFRYNVVVVTEQVTIKSDTLRYNTFTNQTYFYGPTNIKGKDDNLYTENGEYNTKTEKAFFGKKNLYTQDTKSLKGDSLYYDGKRGYGKAVKNIIFVDTKDKLELRGQLGEYFKIDERIKVQINAYVGLGTADSVTVNDKLVPDSLWLGADILEAQMTLQKTLKLIEKPTVLADDEIGVEEEKPNTEETPAGKPALDTALPKKTPVVTPKATTKPSRKDRRNGKVVKPTSTPDSTAVIPPIDSLKSVPDSIDLKPKSIIKNDSLAKDTLIKSQKTLAKDSVKAVPKTSTKKDSVVTAKKLPPAPFNPADTVRTRTISAYHNVRVFKTNLQAKSDSLFFTAADSTLRLYRDPILWSDSSQQTGDTIHVQFKNKKINSAQVLQNGFIVDQETDTTKFNQVKGKLITAFFDNGEIRDMYVDGNAESISYDKKSDGKYQQNQTVSARIKISFADKDISQIKIVKGIEGTFSSPEKATKDAILTGFIWKPELRPKSKNDIINNPSGKTPVKPKVNKVKPKVAPKTNATKTPAKTAPPAKKPRETI
ncbi:OstA-like protein [Pedobacter insulae]|uniref:OstA-like protein n=1 Tax=Pedobacter insulae TaxID=414048 RepID=A0A1I2ZSW7_9SPHI|nr:OstA-like protein [Pedobacter insulae]SFH40619.1 OstA-like protein [Pedobacter insulae]